MTVVAAVCRDPGAPFSIEQLTLEQPGPAEVRVRLVAVGLCHSDLLARDGVLPFGMPGVLGHEGAGVIEAVGSDVHDLVPRRPRRAGLCVLRPL